MINFMEDMMFINYDELYLKIDYVKSKFNGLQREQQEIYKWYFFSHLSILKDFKDNPIKSNTWEYICTSKVSREELDRSYRKLIEFREDLKGREDKRTRWKTLHKN